MNNPPRAQNAATLVAVPAGLLAIDWCLTIFLTFSPDSLSQNAWLLLIDPVCSLFLVCQTDADPVVFARYRRLAALSASDIPASGRKRLVCAFGHAVSPFSLRTGLH